MKSRKQSVYFTGAGALAALLLLGACERAPEANMVAQAKDSLPPAIIAPAEVADAAEPPSYEVGIATAAAERNRAKEKCDGMPEAERATCEAAADAAYETAGAELDDLRGNQQ